MLSRLFMAALRSPAGKGLTSCLSFVMFNCVFVTFPCGILGQVYRFLMFATFLTLISKDVKRVFYLSVFPLVHSSHCLTQVRYS